MLEPPGGGTPSGRGPTSDVPEHTPAREDNLDEMLQRRVPRRVRAVQGFGLLMLVAVLASQLVHALQTTPDVSRREVSTPSPTPVTLGPVLVLSNVSYGAVTLNGKPLAGAPPLVANFRQGLNTLTMTALPFLPLTCQVQWPSAQIQSSDSQDWPSCDVRRDTTAPYHVGGQVVTPVVIIDLWFSSDNLPPPERARALANVAAPLQAVPLRTHVPAGDYFATSINTQGQIRSQRALAPLQADVLMTPTSLNFVGDTFCGDVAAGCVLSAPPSTGDQIGHTWVVAAGLTLAWQFAASDGHVYHAAPYPIGHAPRLVLTYDAQSGWSVDETGTQQLNGFGLPAALTLALSGMMPDLLGNLVIQRGYDITINTLADHGIAGTVLQLQTLDGTDLGTFVWRFGVLLAADAPAHALLPDLPLVPPSELSTVRAASPG